MKNSLLSMHEQHLAAIGLQRGQGAGVVDILCEGLPELCQSATIVSANGTDDRHPLLRSPVLNSPYEYPARHWELDEHGQPTQQIIDTRR